MSQKVYLTRRNLITLLTKLDRVKAGGKSRRTIVKTDVTHPEYPSTDVIWITAVEDEDYYTNRKPGPVFEEGEAFKSKGENQ